MATYNKNWDDVVLVGTINVQNIYRVPVYEINGFSTVDALSSLYDGNNNYIYFTDGTEEIDDFSKVPKDGIVDLNAVIDILNNWVSTEISPTLPSDEILTFNGGTLTKKYSKSLQSGSKYIDLGYYHSDFSKLSLFQCSAQWFADENIIKIIGYASGGHTPGVYVRAKDGDVYKYGVAGFVNFPLLLGPYKINRSRIDFPSFGSYVSFLGLRYGEIKELSEIGDGTYEFDEDTRPPGPYEPYGPGGNSGEGDLPPGTFDDTSDAIPDSSLPTISAADTGFTRIYNPTLAQVQSLAKYLWTDDTVLDTIWNHIKQFFEDPMQAIIGFNLVPCRVPDGGTRSFALMYIDTGVQMTAAASQFVDVDCGTVQLERYYGSALDQNPYTKISCYLPYIGTVHLDTDEVMGTTLQVKYRIDIVSGSCVAKILVDGNVLYQYSGHCAITIPISSADFASYVSAAVSVGAVAAGLAAGAAAGIGVGAAESEALTVTSAEMSAPITASEASALIGGDGATGVATGASFNGINAANITNTVGQVMGSKLQIEHAGSFSGNSGYLGVRRPYLIINRPNMCLPSLYGHLNGYPSMITLNLGECSGFTKVQQVQLTGVTATNPEQSEILQFLKSGVYL